MLSMNASFHKDVLGEKKERKRKKKRKKRRRKIILANFFENVSGNKVR